MRGITLHDEDFKGIEIHQSFIQFVVSIVVLRTKVLIALANNLDNIYYSCLKVGQTHAVQAHPWLHHCNPIFLVVKIPYRTHSAVNTISRIIC